MAKKIIDFVINFYLFGKICTNAFLYQEKQNWKIRFVQKCGNIASRQKEKSDEPMSEGEREKAITPSALVRTWLFHLNFNFILSIFLLLLSLSLEHYFHHLRDHLVMRVCTTIFSCTYFCFYFFCFYYHLILWNRCFHALYYTCS